MDDMHNLSSDVKNLSMQSFSTTGLKSHNYMYSHLWVIKDFESKLDMLKGEYFESVGFSINTNQGQSDWSLWLYPNGCKDANAGYISIYLSKMPTENSGDLKTTASFSILDEDGFTASFSILDEDGFKVHSSPEFVCIYFSDSIEQWGFHQFVSHTTLKEKGLLTGAALTILVEIAFDGEIRIFGGSGTIKQSTEAVMELSSDLKSMFMSAKHTDCEVVCGAKSFPCHKIILSARSSVFDAIFTHDMEEKKLNKVEIKDLDVEVVHDMLQFMYCGEFKKLRTKAADLLPAAEKYDLKKLKQLCVASLCATISVDNVLDLLVLSEVYQCPTLRSSALEFTSHHTKEIIDQDDWREKLGNHLTLFADMFESLARKGSESS